MTPIIIRAFAPPDAASIAQLILPIQSQEFGIPITAADQPDLADIEGFYQNGAGGFWVAQVGEDIVGTIGLKDIGAGQAALRKMFVAATWRGREHRVAQGLLDTVLLESAARGISAIYLGTTAFFLAAHRFYEKNGFTRIEPEDLPTSFPRMAVDTRFYRRSLGATPT